MGDTSQFQSTIDGLETSVAASKVRQSALRKWSVVLNVVLLAIVVIYGLVFYNIFKRNFSQSNLSKTLQSSVTQLTPLISDATIEVVTDVAPVYMKAAADKSDTFMPQFALALEKQSNVFVKNMTRYAQEELKGRLEKIAKVVAAEFRAQYPDLTDEQLNRFVVETEDDALVLFSDLSRHILGQSLPEIAEMKAMTENLPDEFLPQEEMELYRLFLHKLLQLLDTEIMEG